MRPIRARTTTQLDSAREPARQPRHREPSELLKAKCLRFRFSRGNERYPVPVARYGEYKICKRRFIYTASNVFPPAFRALSQRNGKGKSRRMTFSRARKKKRRYIFVGVSRIYNPVSLLSPTVSLGDGQIPIAIS